MESFVSVEFKSTRTPFVCKKRRIQGSYYSFDIFRSRLVSIDFLYVNILWAVKTYNKSQTIRWNDKERNNEKVR